MAVKILVQYKTDNHRLEQTPSNLINIVDNSEIKIQVNASDIPKSLQDSIQRFNSGNSTSEDERGVHALEYHRLMRTPRSPNSTFPFPEIPTAKATNPATNTTKIKPANVPSKRQGSMPPIVVDGKTINQNILIQDFKAKIKGGFSVKHTNNSTILFVDDKEDHQKVLQSVRDENIAHHIYTNTEDKSHKFVLRGLADGTKTQDIEDDIETQYEIKVKNIFRMNTKNRHLFLVVTDPSLTLDYLNKNGEIKNQDIRHPLITKAIQYATATEDLGLTTPLIVHLKPILETKQPVVNGGERSWRN
ncbi:unnamed protein product [Psylliodes chrysocephalus]|uniref:Uncharacterized protein n=1 Tax=Psylliodes chrysocephalus TaxID=3402493 RepID=A0A9P0CUM1_9CUCU|nr:unnamed protein product [Psylliodes chrysocephala]